MEQAHSVCLLQLADRLRNVLAALDSCSREWVISKSLIACLSVGPVLNGEDNMSFVVLRGVPCRAWMRAVSLLSALVLSCPPVRADDWPQWLGPQRDGIWRETGIVERFPEGGPKIRWRTKIGAGYTGPAVADGRVYVMDRQVLPGTKKPTSEFMRGKIPGTERVVCLNEADGKVLWIHEYDCPYNVSYPLGPRTTPVVKDKRVYTLGTEGNLLCLDAEKGEVVWSRELKKNYKVEAPMWGFSAHPLLDGQKLICMVGGKGTIVVAFDKNTGKEIWRALEAREPGYCPPMIYEAGGTRQLIVWDAEAVHGLDPESGKVFWTEKDPSYMGMSISTPRKLGDLLFMTATFGHSTMLRLAADHPGAQVAWRGSKTTGFDSVFGTPYVEGDCVYGTSSNGELCCIKADSGKVLWKTLEPNGGRKNIRSADVFIVKNHDHFFLVNDLGDLIIADLSPKGYKQISRAHLLSPTSAAFSRDVLWSHPAFANRSVYMRNDKEIIAVSLAANGGN
jgi:outer membrane protein assembly factor BamB